MPTTKAKSKKDPRKWFVEVSYQTRGAKPMADGLIFKAAGQPSSSAGFDTATKVRDHAFEDMTQKEALKFQLRFLDLLDTGVIHAIKLGRYQA